MCVAKLLVVDTSMVYDIAPAGPLRTALPNANFGCDDEVVTLPIGSVGAGAWITTGVYTAKLFGFEYGPVFAPSCARARQ